MHQKERMQMNVTISSTIEKQDESSTPMIISTRLAMAQHLTMFVSTKSSRLPRRESATLVTRSPRAQGRCNDKENHLQGIRTWIYNVP